MKNFVVAFIFILLSSSFFTACGPSTEDAIKYNDTLISLQDLIVDCDDAFLNSHDSSPEYIKECHKELSAQVNSSISFTEKIGPFGDYDDFQKACLQFLGEYKNVVEKEYGNMMDIVGKPDSLITTEDDSLYATLFDSSIEKIEHAAEGLTKVQEEFAGKFNFKIAKKPLE